MGETTRHAPRLPVLLRLAALLAFEAGCIAALHWAGRYRFMQIAWSDVPGWLRDTQAEDALAAVIRYVGLALGYWMLATTLAYTAGRLADAPRAIRAVSWLTLPAIRRLVDTALALSITAGTIAATTTRTTAKPEATTQDPQPDHPTPNLPPSEAVGLKVAIYPQSTPLPEPPATARTHQVQSGDSLREIAAEQLGDASQWIAVWRANKDRIAAAGLPADARPQIGWTLVLPSQLQLAAAQHPPTPPEAPDARAQAPPTQVTVEAGDNLWTISERHLSEHLGHDPTASETAPYWQQTINTNLHTLRSGDPDLIYSGERLTLPNVPTATQRTQAPQPPPGHEPPRATEPAPPPRPPSQTPPTTSPPTPTTTQPTEPIPPPSSTHPPTSSTSPTSPANDSADQDQPSDARPDEPERGLDRVLVPVGISAGLASVTLMALARRRRSRRRATQPGSPIGPRPAEDIDTELTLATASGDALQRAWRAATAFAQAIHALTPPPAPNGFVVRPNGDVQIHLSEPSAPVDPFTTDETEPTVWLLHSNDDQAAPATETQVPALEMLVALGHTDANEWVFVDLETLGAVWLDGDEEHARRIIASLVAELALQPLDHYIDLTILGDVDTPEAPEQRMVKHDRLDEEMTQLIERLASETADLLTKEGARSTADARLQGVPRDGLPASVFVVAPGADPVLLGRAARATQVGGHGVALVALDPLEPPAMPLIAHHDGTLDIPHLGLTVTSARLGFDQLRRLDDLLRHEPDSIQTAPAETSPPQATTTQLDENSTAEPEPYDEPAWEYVVRLFADVRVETEDGTPVVFRRGTDGHVQRGPELLAYLALQPTRSASLHEIAENLWWGRRIGDRTVHNLLSATRQVLGGPRLLSHAEGDTHTGRRYTLSTAVVTDHQLLDHSLDYARRIAAAAPDLAVAALHPHLDRIKASAFRSGHLGSGLAEWADAYRIIDRIEQSVIEGVLLVAQLHAQSRDAGSLSRARHVIDKGLIACPRSEVLTRAGMELDAKADDPDGAERRYQALMTHLTRDDLEPDDSTIQLRNEIARTSHRIG